MSASRYISSENSTITKKNTTCKTLAQATVIHRLNRWLGSVARSLELEARSQLK